jgi:hypothetical protein
MEERFGKTRRGTERSYSGNSHIQTYPANRRRYIYKVPLQILHSARVNHRNHEACDVYYGITSWQVNAQCTQLGPCTL